MLKLSEPQKRVLRTMLTLGCRLLSHRARAWDQDDYNWTMYEGHRDTDTEPSVDDVCMLRDHRLLRLMTRSRYGTTVYVLTPKGHEVAKELQNAQTE